MPSSAPPSLLLLLLLLSLLLACCPSVCSGAFGRRHDESGLAAGEARHNLLRASPDVCNGSDWGTAGSFDMYVLAQAWSAEFCFLNFARRYPGCLHPTSWQHTNATLHGLWPQYFQPRGGHLWPQCCATQHGAALNATVVQGELADLQRYWPSEQSPSGTPLNATLWWTEWAKSGTCIDLPQQRYLHLALRLTRELGTPQLLRNHTGSAVNRSVLEAAYNDGRPCSSQLCKVQLQCTTGNFLTEMHTCWDRLGKRIDCPATKLQMPGRCKDGPVHIAAFSPMAELL